MSPSRLTHITKIIDVGEVEFYGNLEWDISFEGWTVNGELLDGWLEKLRSKKVRITIKNLSFSDDTELLEGKE